MNNSATSHWPRSRALELELDMLFGKAFRKKFLTCTASVTSLLLPPAVNTGPAPVPAVICSILVAIPLCFRSLQHGSSGLDPQRRAGSETAPEAVGTPCPVPQASQRKNFLISGEKRPCFKPKPTVSRYRPRSLRLSPHGAGCGPTTPA